MPMSLYIKTFNVFSIRVFFIVGVMKSKRKGLGKRKN